MSRTELSGDLITYSGADQPVPALAIVADRRLSAAALSALLLKDPSYQIARREQVGATAFNRALETLRAAALSEEHRDLLRRGRITDELEPPGLEALAALAQSAGPSRTRRVPRA